MQGSKPLSCRNKMSIPQLSDLAAKCAAESVDVSVAVISKLPECILPAVLEHMPPRRLLALEELELLEEEGEFAGTLVSPAPHHTYA